MKIIATIIRNSISRGIPEGTKVPEKPNSNLFVSTEARAFGMDERGYVKAMKKHERDLQALWDSSIEWEDQRLVNENLFASRDKISEAELAEFALTGKHRDGIYPLEGVNAEKVDQVLNDSESDDPKTWVWCDVTHSQSVTYHKYGSHTCQILRLIPQPDSEQKKDALGGLPEIEYPESLPNRIEGTEVSEPTICPICSGEMSLTDYRVFGKCMKCKVGVDEKKEPETWSHQNFCKKCQLLTAHISANNVCIVCGTVNFRSVSEEEPNQEELWIEALKYLRHMLGSYSTTIHKAKGMAEYFHIQKLKP